MFLFCISLPFFHYLGFISTISPAVPLARLSLPSHLLIISPQRGSSSPCAVSRLSWCYPVLVPIYQTPFTHNHYYFISFFSFIRVFFIPKIQKINNLFIIHILPSLHPAADSSSAPFNWSVPHSSRIKMLHRQSVSQDKLTLQVTVYVAADKNQSAPQDTSPFVVFFFCYRPCSFSFLSPQSKPFFVKALPISLYCSLFNPFFHLFLSDSIWILFSSVFDLVHMILMGVLESSKLNCISNSEQRLRGFCARLIFFCFVLFCFVDWRVRAEF